MENNLMWIWWAFTAALCAWKIGEGLLRPHRMLEWPFLACAMWAYFYVYMAYDAKLGMPEYLGNGMANIGQLMPLLCLSGVLVGWSLGTRRAARLIPENRAYRYHGFWLAGIFFLVVGAAGAYSVMHARNSGTLNYEESSGYWILLFYVGYPGLAITVWSIFRMEPSARQSLWFVTAVALTAFMFPHVIDARRGPLFPAIMVLLLVPPMATRRSPNRVIFCGGLLAVGLVMLLFLQVREVTYNGGTWSEALHHLDVGAAVEEKVEQPEDNEYINNCQLIATVYQNGKYQYGTGHFGLLWHWIPRAVWKDKPTLGEGSYSFDELFDDVEAATGFRLLGAGAASGGGRRHLRPVRRPLPDLLAAPELGHGRRLCPRPLRQQPALALLLCRLHLRLPLARQPGPRRRVRSRHVLPNRPGHRLCRARSHRPAQFPRRAHPPPRRLSRAEAGRATMNRRPIVMYLGGFAQVGGIETFARDFLLAIAPDYPERHLVMWGARAKDHPLLNEIADSGARISRSSWRWGCLWNLPDFVLVPAGLNAIRRAAAVVFKRPPPRPILGFLRRASRLFGPPIPFVLVMPYRPLEYWGASPDAAEYEHFDIITVQSEDGVRDLQNMGFRGRIENIPLLPPKVFAPVAYPSAAGEGVIRLGFLGRMVAQKNLGYLLEIYRVLTRNPHPPARFELHLFGDGPQRREFQKKCVDLKLSGVTFHGEIPRADVARAIDSCDLFLNTSLTEGQCLVVLEVLSRGRPVVATPVGALPEVLRPRELGRLAPLDDADSFAARVNEIVDSILDARTTPQTVVRAFNLKYDYDAIVNRYLAVLASTGANGAGQ